MKSIILAAALSVSGVALAQTATPTQDTAQSVTTTQTTTQPMATTQTSAQPTTTTQTTPQPSGQTVDDPSQSTGPRGVTQQGTVPSGQSSGASGGDYPPCSRTVTDSCIQTYEKGVRASLPRR